jgi:uncharacterized protein YdeI (YjbR/CyaY-like superfamily)
MKTEKMEVATGVVHKLPNDLRRLLLSNREVLEKWNSLTPLARNEWICWTITVKKPETRIEHIKRVQTDLLAGKRRPCCWIGCIHRIDKPISFSVKGLLSKR